MKRKQKLFNENPSQSTEVLQNLYYMFYMYLVNINKCNYDIMTGEEMFLE